MTALTQLREVDARVRVRDGSEADVEGEVVEATLWEAVSWSVRQC